MKKLIKNIRYSLISRLILLLLVTTFALLVVVRISTLAIMNNQFKNNILPHIFEYQRYIESEIGSPPNIERAKAIALRTGATIHIRGESINWSSDDKPFDPYEIEFEEHHDHDDENELMHGESDRVRYLLSERGDHKIYVGFARRPERRGEGLIGLLLIIGVVYICYLGIRSLFRPIETIRLGVQKMGQGELDHRIEIKRKDELGELATTVNTMASDIEGMLDSKREMLLAISHELRSPLTRSRVSVELIDDDQIRKNLSRDMKEMEQLITELLESERLNQRHAPLNRTSVIVNDLIETLLEESFSTDNIETEFNAEQVAVQLDEPRIRLLVKNLLTNAVRYHRPDRGRITISTSSQVVAGKRMVFIAVTDSGVGIEPEFLPHITEPFYRPDPSRQRKTGGYGLGLYLCRMITEAHGGRLEITSTVDVGTRVQVSLTI
ncbi:MAG: HAMP domain-containing histidine kinase [Proteobacteria bacterium]|nr:HAMP domain-containing histidine kinase [Pseudomonadota bacterium]